MGERFNTRPYSPISSTDKPEDVARTIRSPELALAAGPALSAEETWIDIMVRHYRSNTTIGGGPDLDPDELLLHLFSQWQVEGRPFRNAAGNLDINLIRNLLATTEVKISRRELDYHNLTMITQNEVASAETKEFYRPDEIHYGVLPFVRQVEIDRFLIKNPQLIRSPNPMVTLEGIVRDTGACHGTLRRSS